MAPPHVGLLSILRGSTAATCRLAAMTAGHRRRARNIVCPTPPSPHPAALCLPPHDLHPQHR
jgi:hypothetical protein